VRSDVESLERDQNALPSASETIQLRNIFTHIIMGMGMGKGKGKGCLHAKVRNSSTERLMCGIDESLKRRKVPMGLPACLPGWRLTQLCAP